MAKAIKLNDPNSPAFTVVRVLRKVMLSFASIGNNSNKYYQLELQEGFNNTYRVYTEYGRVGKTKVQEGRYFTSRWEADRCWEDLFDQKTQKGYREIELVENSAPTTSKPKVVNLNQIDDKVLRLIAKFYQEAIGFVTASVETPLGKISERQVLEGKRILGNIERYLNEGKSRHYEELSNEFYRTIPVVFSSDRREMIINTFSKLQKYKEMIDVMQSVAVAQETLTATAEEKYKSLGATIKVASAAEVKRIKQFINCTRSQYHHFKINVLDVFTVEQMYGWDKFNPYKVDTMELFHGSRNCNLLGIMQHGLKIKPSTAVHTGSMFGAGIYFADQSSKSANYCWGFGSAGQTLSSNYLLICDVAIGKVKEYTDAQTHLTSAPRGYNSVMGKKGSGLLHNEYIVYRENQARIKYIIEFERA
ncbi:WGR domain-containing protein [Syntrophomonas palmitatica]|uniref:WGR domain-containing protein n=1 Tax=Syntrophomonas palmitatica TaxID=402877 RepID=UPI0006D029FC|nr:WGR domain-containing protein [Syntrophomonas palmitatica]